MLTTFPEDPADPEDTSEVLKSNILLTGAVLEGTEPQESPQWGGVGWGCHTFINFRICSHNLVFCKHFMIFRSGTCHLFRNTLLNKKSCLWLRTPAHGPGPLGPAQHKITYFHTFSNIPTHLQIFYIIPHMFTHVSHNSVYVYAYVA